MSIGLYDLIILTECWLTCDTPVPALAGFASMHKNSVHGRAGGICIYHKTALPLQEIILDSYINDYAEAEFMAVELSQLSIVIIVVYRHPNCGITAFLKTLDNIVGSSVCANSRRLIVLCGDLKIDMLSDNIHTADYIAMMNAYSFISLINAPTFVRAAVSSCLDHVWVKNSQKSAIKADINLNEIADHKSINIEYWAGTGVNCRWRIVRPHEERQIKMFIVKLEQIDFGFCDDKCMSLDEQLHKFLLIIVDLYNRCFPVKKLSVITKGRRGLAMTLFYWLIVKMWPYVNIAGRGIVITKDGLSL